jgi:hypothetical protein
VRSQQLAKSEVNMFEDYRQPVNTIGVPSVMLDTNTPSPERLGSEPRRLAAVELPIEVTPLCAIADGLVAKYGKSVTMRQAGTHLVFEIPNTGGERR